MITQNLFNKKQKAYDPFASNVKLVGDDITEKDYNDFFEGFNDPYGEKKNKSEKKSLPIYVQTQIRETSILRVRPLHKQPHFLRGLIRIQLKKAIVFLICLRKRQPAY